MRIAIVMPQLGLTMEEGTVSGWLKKPGDKVKKNDLVFSVSTDKVEMDVESTAEGTLGEIIVSAGETVPVGTVLAHVEGAGEDVAATGNEQPSPDTFKAVTAPSATPLPPQSAAAPGDSAENPSERQRRASPRAKRLAKEFSVDVAAVRGTGLEGQVTEQDIRNAGKPGERAPHFDGSRRQLIAEKLTLSIQTIPTFSVSAEVNAEKILAAHESLNSLATAAGTKLTLTDLLLAVFARALKSSPELNAVWEGKTVRSLTSVDIGLAVATPKGVIAPVLRKLDAIELRSLVTRRIELVEKARSGRLSLADLEGGVGTLSNLGMYRVDHFQAIISPGQSSILAVGQIRQRPWVEKTLTVKPTVMLNLTVDHRVADGAAAAIFLGKIVELIENPQGLSWPRTEFSGDGARRRPSA